VSVDRERKKAAEMESNWGYRVMELRSESSMVANENARIHQENPIFAFSLLFMLLVLF
jgi:hypothetical protein